MALCGVGLARGKELKKNFACLLKPAIPPTVHVMQPPWVFHLVHDGQGGIILLIVICECEDRSLVTNVQRPFAHFPPLDDKAILPSFDAPSVLLANNEADCSRSPFEKTFHILLWSDSV